MAEINRIIFMGTPAFAVPTLQSLIDHGENIVTVITQPDRPKGRGRKLTPPPVKILAESANIPILQPTKIKTDSFHETLAQLAPDLIIVTAYGRILPGHILNLPPLGTINVHGSLLPKYRGAAPIQWAVIRGESETGVTIMQMDEGMDTGDMLLTATIPISQEDTAGSLAEKMATQGGIALCQALDLLRRDQLPPQKQDDSLATPAPPLSKKDGMIDWTKSAFEISCLIRGLDPWPTAYTMYKDKWLRFFRPKVISEDSTEAPGTLCRADKNGLLIRCGRDSLLVEELQLEGAKRMGVDAFLRGRPMEQGLVFG